MTLIDTDSSQQIYLYSRVFLFLFANNFRELWIEFFFGLEYNNDIYANRHH